MKETEIYLLHPDIINEKKVYCSGIEIRPHKIFKKSLDLNQASPAILTDYWTANDHSPIVKDII